MSEPIYKDIINTIKVFSTINTLEKSTEVSPSEIMEAVKSAREIDQSIISDETYKELESEIIPNINSVFGREVAFYKCKAILKTINLSLLSRIRIKIEEYKSYLKEIKNKNIILDNLYDVLNKYIEKTEPLKNLVVSSFEDKEKFLNTCNSCLSRHYRGLLNLDNSPVKLGKVLEKIMNSVFDPEGPTKGEEIIKNNKLDQLIDMAKYYSDREVLQKTNLNGLTSYNFNNVIEGFGSLPRLQDYNLDGIVAFVRLAGNGIESSETSDAQANAIMWMTLVNMMRIKYQNGLEIFNSIIKPRLGKIGELDLKDITTMLDKLEELYKINDQSGDIEKYQQLIKYTVEAYDLYIKLELYDVLSFITGTEYLTFTFIIIYMLFESHRQENSNTTGE